jgi:hypothetical protein
MVVSQGSAPDLYPTRVHELQLIGTLFRDHPAHNPGQIPWTAVRCDEIPSGEKFDQAMCSPLGRPAARQVLLPYAERSARQSDQVRSGPIVRCENFFLNPGRFGILTDKVACGAFTRKEHKQR